jgi:hypothetical protein
MADIIDFLRAPKCEPEEALLEILSFYLEEDVWGKFDALSRASGDTPDLDRAEHLLAWLRAAGFNIWPANRNIGTNTDRRR